MKPSVRFSAGLLIILTGVVLAIAACGGSSSSGASCSDACNHLFSCAGTLSVSPADFLGSNYTSVSACISRCQTGGCPNNQQLLDCAVGVQCNNLSQVEADTTACFRNAGCTP
jgi:hypothetical protein